MKNINLILGRIILVLWFAPLSSIAFAGWDDDRNSVFNKIENLKTAVDNIVTQMENGKDAVSAGNIQDTINAAKDLLGDNIPSQADVQAFANQGCAVFVNDLTMLSTGIFGLGNSLANFHGLPVEFQIQDPGLVDLVGKVPCGFLLPVEKIARKLPLFDSEFIYQLNNVSTDIDLLKTIVYPDQLAPSSLSASISEPNDIELGAVCEIINSDETAVFFAHNSVRGLGLTALGVGTVLQAIGKTALAGPDEVKVAIWGWVGSRIRNSPAMTLGNFLAGSGHALLSISGSVSRTRNRCILRNDHIALQADHDALLANQQMLKDGQLEILRLMLTPQGRRSSIFCHEDDCELQDFPQN